VTKAYVDHGKVYSSVIPDNTKKVKIPEDKLPQPVQDALTDDINKGWKIEVVYLVQEDQEYYQVTLKKDFDKKTINIDKDGNKMASLD